MTKYTLPTRHSKQSPTLEVLLATLSASLPALPTAKELAHQAPAAVINWALPGCSRGGRHE